MGYGSVLWYVSMALYPKKLCRKQPARAIPRILIATSRAILRACAKRLRDAHANGSNSDELAAMRKDMMGNVWHLLAVCLGEPPEHFEVRLRE